MDIALILEDLVPGAQYAGSLRNGKTSYDRLRWNDTRTKPTWNQIVQQWAQTQIRKDRLERAKRVGDNDGDLLEKLVANGALSKSDLSAEKLDAINARRELRGESPL